MSIWTHVAAVIRIDDLRFAGLTKGYPDVGTSCTFDSTVDEYNACDIPNGSEGSLQYHVQTNPDGSAMAAYVVTVWGDLRDYNDANAVIAYLNRITAGRSIRQGVAHIAVEGLPAQTLTFFEGHWGQV